MKCLYCGKRLALLRKLTDSEFCTDAHRRAYQKEQEQMALARLSDAGKPKKKQRPEPEKQVPEPQSEPQFVDWKHRAADWSALRPIETEPMLAEPGRFLPEESIHMDAYPAPAGSLPIRQPGWTVIPPSQFHTEPVPQNASPAIAQPPVGKDPRRANAARLGTRRPLPEPSVINVSHGSLISPFGPLVQQQAPQLPVFGDGRLITMPSAQDVVVQLATLETAMMSHDSLSAEFQTKPLISGMGARLHVADYSVQHREPAQDSASDLPSVLMRLTRPEPRPGKRGARKVRPRELFFPLPRLGDLSSTASQLGGKNIAVVSPGTNSKRWKPGAVSITFRRDVLENRKDRGVAPFPVHLPDGASPCHLPSLNAVSGKLSGLSEGGRIDDIRLFLAGEAPQDTPIRVGWELATEPMDSLTAKPLLWVWFPQPLIGQARSLDPLTASALPVESKARQSSCHPAVPQPEPLRMPSAAPLLWRAATMDFSRQLASVSVDLVAPATDGPQGAASEFVLTKPTIEASSPGSKLRREYMPAVARKVVPLPSGNGVPYPQNTVAIQELSPVWPDPEFLYPCSRNGVIEDSAMREAVKAMSALLLADENRSFFSRLSLPFSRSDSKWLVMSIPAILLLSLYVLTNRDSRPDLGSLPQAAEVTDIQHESSEAEPPPPSEPPPAAKPAVVVAEKAPAPPVQKAEAPVAILPANRETAKPEGFLAGIQQTILQRAAVNLSDDFRSGLGDWEGEGDWSKRWAYDAAGFLHTGPLILYKPSLSLTDYRMEFLGRIEKKSMGWVYRAADRKNYYAHRIVLTTGGPLPTAVVERYAVVGGKTYSMARRPLPMQVQTDTSYRVRMDVRGNGFTLSVQGQVVDHWSDDRLKIGGVGFFSARGEQASLRWVELSHQYDFLGRLCAFLAPYSLPAKEGSLK